MKSKILLMVVLTILLVFISSYVFGLELDIEDSQIPESWYEAPEKSSELGIKEFNQSPMLDDEVADGVLPPVKDRLPEDPPVIEPYKEVGKYGGTLTIWDVGLGGQWNSNQLYTGTFFDSGASGIKNTPDAKPVPFYIKDWKYSNNYKDLTLYLRKGAKWSDGEPITSEDFIFWWKREAKNKGINPTPPEEWSPPLIDVTKEGKWKVTYHYGQPVPHQHINLKYTLGIGDHIAPAHFMKQIHPDFIGEDKAQEMAEKEGLDNWFEYYGQIKDSSYVQPDSEYVRPVAFPYIAEKRTETTLILKRNPYFPFIDTEGNQLPYIDKIMVRLANEREMMNTKAATGDADIAYWGLKDRDIPLYKRNEDEANYTTYIYRRGNQGQCMILPNLSHQDPKMREIFLNDKFRKALSVGIDRSEINRKVYFGRAIEMQITYPPINDSFKEEYAKAYAEYDPEQAKKWLDEIGMRDVDGDGYRETPEEEKFKPTIMFTEYDIDPTPILELIKKQWQEIGINIQLKHIGGGLRNQRANNNDYDFNVWIANGQTGEAGRTLDATSLLAPVGAPAFRPWPGYVHWYNSDGERGMEPPEEIKKLIDYAEKVGYGTDEQIVEENLQKLLEAQAENVWSIGTVGMGPKPIIVKNRLKNVPNKGLWSFRTGFMQPTHVEQFYLEE